MDATQPRQLLRAEIRGKLGALRVAISMRLAMEGLAWTVLALVAMVFVTLAFDYFLRLERPLRVLIAALAAAGVLAVIWKQLTVPLRVPMTAPALALLVEQRFGQLGDRLISAVQFSEFAEAQFLGISRAMIARTAAEANDLAEPLRFQDVINRRGLFRTWSLAGCALGLLLGFGILQGDILSRWFSRNVLFSDVPWPQETYLTVRGEPANFTVLRGDDLTVVVDVEPRSMVVPDHVTLHARYAAIGRTEERIDPDAENPHRFVKVFAAVPEEFEFHVTGGDDRRDARNPHRVVLIDPPAVRKVRFTVRHPSYMKRARPVDVPGGSGALGVPVGANVVVKAESNKPLRSAAILLDDKMVSPMRPQIGADGKPDLTGMRHVGSFEVSGANKPVTKILRFALTDVDGHSSRRGAKYMIQLQPDHRPTVDLKKLRIGVRISPRAVLPLHVRVRDDHGIATAEVLVRRSGDANDANTQPVTLPTEVGRELDVQKEFDLEPLRPKPGSTIYVTARSADTLPRSLGGPNVGESASLSFTVVRSEDLMGEFVRRQKEIRLEFVQALALQESARAKTAGAKRIFAGGKVEAEARRLLLASSGLQQSVGLEVAKAADGLDDIVEEMKNNRIGTKTEREQIRGGIVKPLRQLGEPIRKVTGSIRATKAVKDAGELKQQAEAIEEIQRDVFKQMDDILQRMAKLESKQELANKLRLIIGWSEKLLKSIKKKQEDEVKTVLDPTTQPAEKRR